MTVTIDNPIIADIISTVKKMSKEEQQVLLTRLRIQSLLLKKSKPLVKAIGVKPLSMKEIDRIKHESRKQNASK